MAKMESSKDDTTKDKALIKKAIKQHDSQEHKGGKGTVLKLKAGGATSVDCMRVGRNMARANNQKSGGK